MKVRKRSTVLRWLSPLWQGLWCAFIYLIMEAMSRHSLRLAITYMVSKPWVFFYNTCILFVTFLVVYLFRHRAFVRTLLSLFWLALGVINGVLLANRVTPFTGPDVRNLADGKAVMSKYLTQTELTFIYVGVAILGLMIILLFFKAPKYRGRMHRFLSLLLLVACAGGMFPLTNLFLDKRILSNYFGNIAFAYEDYGYPYCLITTVFNTGISQPRGYSSQEIARIKRSVSSLPATTEEKRPNIIFLQLESFMDPLEVDYLTCSEDPIPIFRSLMNEYSSGYYKVPAVGAGTANSEFESITGMSLHYFGPGEYPYKSILQESTCESIPYILKSLGYSTHAIHNNEANFYARRTVFPKLGFDTFTSAEYMPREDEKTPLGWIKDEILTDEILKCLNSTEDQPDYVYCISVQGHGDYPEEPVLEEPLITVSGSATPEQDCKWEYYVNQIKEMDNFVGELVAALSEFPEEVILVMYGDHLPTMGLTVEDLKNRYLFQTSYVIWDNMGLPKKKENLATYQMGAEILGRLDIHDGTLVRFHQARRNSKNYQVDLEMLQYDMLYGKKYCYEGGVNPFTATKMRLGLEDVTLDGIELVSESNYTYYVKGTNFTPSSQVKLNGEWYDTIYLSETMLLISGTKLDAFDRLSVVQRSNSSTRKALTKSYDRAYYMLDENSVWNVNKLKK